jgi:penicillin-binding protein 2
MQHAKRVLLWLVIAALLAACRDTAIGDSVNKPAAVALTQKDAEEIAASFLGAWQQSDYTAMYGLISPRSREKYTPETFAAEYQTAADLLSFNGLETQITNAVRQGTTVAISYDVTFHTVTFGDIPDAGRTMRLIETPDGWRVAWSRLDILPEYAEGTRLENRPVIPPRGNIYDRNGQVLVDQNGSSVTLYMVQENMPNVDDCITLLSRITRREYNDIATEFGQFLPVTRFFAAELDNDIYQAEQDNLRQLCNVDPNNPADVGTRTSRRYYGDLAPHIVGYVSPIRPEQLDEYTRLGYPSDALVGQEGIEQTYEAQLAGKVGGRLAIISPTGETLRVLAESNAVPGQDVYLTIDRTLQWDVEQAFVDAYNYAQPTWAQTSRGAAAVVMDVKSGEILAMASYPGYSPGLFQPDSPVYDPVAAIQQMQNDARKPLLNRATTGQYPAGSVFKIASIAAGLDSGVYSKDTTITCDGVWEGAQYGDVIPERKDWKPEGHGPGIDAHWGLTYSCDPYFWQLGVALQQADPNILPDYAKRMGLGVATGQKDLPEAVGYIPNPADNRARRGADWALGDTLNLVIGQGDTQVTPLQLTRMVAAVSNGGTLYKPLLVSKVQPRGGAPTAVAQPTPTAFLDFDPGVLEVIRQAMCDVTLADEGTAHFIFQEWYDFQRQYNIVVCGKTGTAQTGGETTRPQAWFVAFAPMNDPQIAVVVIVENSCEGSEVAAPIVRRIVEDYYGMPHSELPPLWQDGCVELGE